jgi:hypothetical protein
MVAGFPRQVLRDEAPRRQGAGLRAAQRNTDTMNAWLRENFVEKEDATDLTVAATAFLGRGRG